MPHLRCNGRKVPLTVREESIRKVGDDSAAKTASMICSEARREMSKWISAAIITIFAASTDEDRPP